jgi:hypothetical protein
MKKIALSFLTLSLAGCSTLQGLSFSQPTPAVVLVTSTIGPTVTYVSDSYTNTPDPFATNTQGPTSTPPSGTPLTNTPAPTFTITTRPTITLEPVDTTLFTPGPNPFTLLSKSTTQLVWGSTCEGARSIKFVVQLITPLRGLKYVTLWYRLQDKYSARHTEWQGGAIMSDNDRGTYFYTIELDQINDYIYYEDAWFQFQFVASNVYLKRLGSSVVDRNSVSITHCKVFNP